MITVIIPTYNNEDIIGRAIESVINQTYSSWEILVVDDCSTDNTPNVVNKYVEKYKDKVRYIKNEANQGVGKTRKIGVEAAKGDFIAFLDSDDYLLKEYLEGSMILQQQHDSDVVYTNIVLKYKEQIIANEPKIPEHVMEGKISPTLHLNLNKKFLTGKLYRTSLLRSVHMSENRIAEDTQTLFFICYQAKKVRSSNFCGYVHECRENSLLGFETEDNLFGFNCLSVACDIEIMQFLLDHDDKESIDYVISKTYIGFLHIRQKVKKREFKAQSLEEHKKEWRELIKWFEEHKDLMEKALLNTKGYYPNEVYKTVKLDYLIDNEKK